MQGQTASGSMFMKVEVPPEKKSYFVCWKLVFQYIFIVPCCITWGSRYHVKHDAHSFPFENDKSYP